MRYAVKRSPGGINLFGVRNNYRPKAGEAVLEGAVEESAARFVFKVDESYECGPGHRLYKLLDPHAPEDLGPQRDWLDGVADEMGRRVLKAIKTEVDDMKKKGLTHPNPYGYVRRRVAERLAGVIREGVAK